MSKINNFLSLLTRKYKNKISKNRIFWFFSLLLLLILTIFFYNLNSNDDINTSNFLINERNNNYAVVIDSYPKNNTTTSAITLSLDFSENIKNQKFSIKTNPQMNVTTDVLDSNPYKLFIIPQRFWDETSYTITIQSPILQEDYVLNISFLRDNFMPEVDERGLGT